ncbi:TMAO reductase system periplasmic protein TorT [Ancylobacter sp. WKF20]|uniref:TMAO reductase system periplasmic protein TorT n=1 Tax=Ancylobacter sp. WKF20 TaxID=3039801 RepID=UPI00243468B3|nr:TMAO reductase system periplasmic protein TorT [Ancylobacter sp. WKF20]WGD29739.1 TMAO reductase system periplasmic protein TorT [Ancylobacter sp. WKF20]
MNITVKLGRFCLGVAMAASALVVMAPGLRADTAGWSFPVLVQDPPRKTGVEPFVGKPVDYQALSPKDVTKKWNICYLVPHTTNDIMRAYLYGAVEEAKRLGAKLTIYDAGGYGNVDKQLAQFDDCVTLGADAIIVFAVSTSGLSQKIREARAKGVVVVDNNVGVDTEADARVVVSYTGVGEKIGKVLAEKHPAGSGKVSVVVMPGPAGIPWAEDSVIGFKQAVKGSDVVIEKVVYGQAGRLDQQPLVEDVLVTYPKLNYIIGMGSSTEAAINSLREQGRVGEVGLYATFLTPDLMPSIRKGDVAGVVVENSVIIDKLLIDMTVRALEKKLTYKDAIPDVTLVDKSTLDKAIEANVAPSTWKVQFKVD